MVYGHTYKEVEHGEQGQEHEEEHGKEARSKDAERKEAGQEGEEVAGPVRAAVIPEQRPRRGSASSGCSLLAVVVADRGRPDGLVLQAKHRLDVELAHHVHVRPRIIPPRGRQRVSEAGP